MELRSNIIRFVRAITIWTTNSTSPSSRLKGLAGLGGAFIRPYSPNRIATLADTVKELNHPQKTNLWLDQKKDKEIILGAIKKRMATKANKQEVAVISSLLSALDTVTSQRHQEKQQMRIAAEELKALRATTVSQGANDKFEHEMVYYKNKVEELRQSLEKSKEELQKFKYFLDKSFGINMELKCMVDRLPPQHQLSLSQISGFITTMEKEDRHDSLSVDIDALKNELEGSIDLEHEVKEEEGARKKHVSIWEMKRQKMLEILEDTLPAFL